MSKIALSGDASGTGTFTIASPNSNSNYTLTLPAESGTVVTTASTGKVIPAAALPNGSIIQVVSGSLGTITTSSGSLQYSGTTVNITLSAASNKVLVVANPGIQIDTDNDSQGFNNGVCSVEYSTNGGSSYTVIGSFGVPGRGGNGNMVHFSYLLSPATTNQIRFRVGISKSEGARTIQMSTSWGLNVCSLLEVVA
jgi:hypothetical protein